ncbi:MAG: DUF2029 domain-containing protein [Candidatus Methanomethylophilaceae archaeon]|nr:DUF2029 domain-containing protein [Candidatus Methanomethylophilaceae archaeon]
MNDCDGASGRWSSGFLATAPFAILVVGLAIRLLLAPTLSYPFDQTYWSIDIANAEAGYGLYGLPGFYYTPVWGYLLGFDGLVMNAFTDLGEMGYRFVDLVGIESLTRPYYTATVSTPEFSLLVKAAMILADVAVGYMVYRMTLSSTGSKKDATASFAIWFLCPVVVYMSGIQAQFDCISAMLALLSVLLLEKDHAFLAGMTFSIAALTKLFPAALLFVLAIYIVRKHPGQYGTRRLAFAVAGALAGFLLMYAPQIADGTLMESLSFMISRASEDMSVTRTLKMVLMTCISLLIVAAAAVRFWRLPAGDAPRELRRFALVTLAGAAFMSSGPQYCIVCMPLLAWYAVSEDRALVPWAVMLGVFATLSAFFNNGLSLLAMGSEYLGFIEPASLIDLMRSMDTPVLLSLTPRDVPVVVGDLGVMACLLLIVAFVWIGPKAPSETGKVQRIIAKAKTFGREADGA